MLKNGFDSQGVYVFIHRHAAGSEVYATLTKPLVYMTSDGRDFVVPKSFDTNFASVPKILWSILPPVGKHTQAAVLHDYLYTFGFGLGVSRKEADEIFYEALLVSRVAKPAAYIIYQCVRLFGKSHYKKEK